jgi:hypothetical protein
MYSPYVDQNDSSNDHRNSADAHADGHPDGHSTSGRHIGPCVTPCSSALTFSVTFTVTHAKYWLYSDQPCFSRLSFKSGHVHYLATLVLESILEFSVSFCRLSVHVYVTICALTRNKYYVPCYVHSILSQSYIICMTQVRHVHFLVSLKNKSHLRQYLTLDSSHCDGGMASMC